MTEPQRTETRIREREKEPIANAGTTQSIANGEERRDLPDFSAEQCERSAATRSRSSRSSVCDCLHRCPNAPDLAGRSAVAEQLASRVPAKDAVLPILQAWTGANHARPDDRDALMASPQFQKTSAISRRSS